MRRFTSSVLGLGVVTWFSRSCMGSLARISSIEGTLRSTLTFSLLKMFTECQDYCQVLMERVHVMNASNSREPPSILLIDTDAADLQSTQTVLLQYGYEVTTSNSLLQARTLLMESPVHYLMILCSVHLKRYQMMTYKWVCFEVTRMMQQCPIILMAYDSEPSPTLQGMIARQFCGYIRKPLSLETKRGFMLYRCFYSMQAEAAEDFDSIPELPSQESTPESREESDVQEEADAEPYQLSHAQSEMGDGQPQGTLLLESLQSGGPNEAIEAQVTIVPDTVEDSSAGLEIVVFHQSEIVQLDAQPEGVQPVESINQALTCAHGPGHAHRSSPLEPDNGAAGRVRRPRMSWSSEMRDRFHQVVLQLGGRRLATPKNIWLKLSENKMDITREQVKNHWRSYRKKACSDRATTTCSSRSVHGPYIHGQLENNLPSHDLPFGPLASGTCS